jgi:hypothetical protein
MSSPQLTSEQVQAAVRTSTDLDVSVTQLGRWAHAGLLPPATRHGKHGTRGVDWLWDPDCVPRAELIATTLRYGKGALKEAATVLAVKGYPPRADVLKQILEEYLDSLDRAVHNNRTFLKSKLSLTSKRERFRESVRRRTKHLPAPVQELSAQSATAIAGLWPAGDADLLSQAQPYLEVARQRQALGAIDPEPLLQAYGEASHGLSQTIALFAALFDAAAPSRVGDSSERQAAERSAITSDFTEVLPPQIPLSLADQLRLPIVSTQIALAQYGPPPESAQQHFSGALVSMLAGLGLSTNVPPSGPPGS